MSRSIRFGLWVLPALLLACAAPMPTALSPGKLPAQVLLPYSFRSMAFDGENLRQIVQENKSQFLLTQTLLGHELQRTPVSAPIPSHRSLTWGQHKLWALDQDNTLYRLSPEGQLEQTLKLTELPEARTAEQLIWIGDQLWLLNAGYLAANGETVPARFYQLDPATGKVLGSLLPQETPEQSQNRSLSFSNFMHQNLSGDTRAFYVARGNIFDKSQNLVYRIDRSNQRVSTTALERVYTGLGSSFLWQGQLMGIELIDTSNCGEYCRGKLESIGKPD